MISAMNNLYVTASRVAQSINLVTPRDEQEVVYEFLGVPGGWMGIGSLLLVVAFFGLIFFFYKKEGRRGSSNRLRMSLAVLRCLVILSLVMILMEPVKVRYLHRIIDSYTILLVDDSSSMDISDTYISEESSKPVKTLLASDSIDTVSRREITEKIINSRDKKFIQKLAEKNRVKIYRFSDQPEMFATVRSLRERGTSESEEEKSSPEIPIDIENFDLSISAQGSSTNIERAVRNSIESVGQAPISSVILMTDGGINEGESVESIALYANQREIPVHVIGVGDPSPPRNIRITEILSPENVLLKDPFAITGRISTQGIANERIQLSLRESTSAGKGRVVETREVKVDEYGKVEPVVFQLTPDKAGRYRYTLETPVNAWETIVDDNVKNASVQVIESRNRVLLVSGSPSWDYRFLSRLLERDKSIELSCWLQSADMNAVRDGNRVIDRLPMTSASLFEYDAIILMDVNHYELTEEWARIVDTFVSDYGGGLLVTASRKHTPDFFRQKKLKPMISLLPVTPDPDAGIILNQIGHYQKSANKIAIPERAVTHPVMQMAEDPITSRKIWREIGEFYWYYPVLRAKPVAMTLMEHSDSRKQNMYGQHILAASQFTGAGRTAFLGFDGTWRWRKNAPQLFDRFWIQLIRYLVEGKQLGGTKRGSLFIEGDQFALGEIINVSARMYDAQFAPLLVDKLNAQYELDGERFTFNLSADPEQPGWYEGQFVPQRIGSYRVTLDWPIELAEEKVILSRELYVSRPNKEIQKPQMNKSGLQDLARLTGGTYVDVDAANELAETIPDVHEEETIRTRPVALWDNMYVLLILAGFLSLEWAMRKLNRML